jgi:hypothetical protein
MLTCQRQLQKRIRRFDLAFLIKLMGVDKADGTQFRSSAAFGILNYYELQFDAGQTTSRELIPRIMIGPGNETVGFMRAHVPSTLFEKLGFCTLVEESKSSLRFLR